VSDDKPTTPRPRSKAEALEHLLELDEQAIEESEKLTDEQLAEQLRQSGVDPEKLRARFDAIAARADATHAPEASKATPPAAKVVSLDAARAKKRKPPPLWLLVAAGIGVAAALGGGGYLSFYTPESPAPSNGPAPIPSGPPQPPPALLAAAKLRDKAANACAMKLYQDCRDWLDEAEKLDPTGEKSERVQGLRDQIYLWQHPDAGTDAASRVKPPL
jgi:hypothetical protein